MDGHERQTLQRIARQAMIDKGLEPDFPPAVLIQLDGITTAATRSGGPVRDLRSRLWCSIDNDDSRDLDQLTVAESLPDATVKISIAVADVDAIVYKGSAIDAHAQKNTTSVYTGAQIFPMLPDKLSTDLTSLNGQQDRLAIIVEIVVDKDGSARGSDVYRGVVRNQAKLAYNSVAAWLDGQGPMPSPVAAVKGLDENLRLQDRAAQQLKAFRHEHGALDLETLEPRAVFDGDDITDLALDRRNRAKDLIEDFMIAANGATARFLESKRFPSLRRVVRSPERWQRIADVALGFGEQLPPEPDSKALEQFLVHRRSANPSRFPDLSLTIVKLMGAGEYVLEWPGQTPVGHFGLAVKDYTHSTAPNRRYPDLITERLLKAALAGSPVPYSGDELSTLARHCTEQEDAANKVERLVRKAAAATLLANRIGEEFDGIITGASNKGTWVRIFQPPVEGRVEQGYEGLDVGNKVRVRLIHTDVERGFIDFARTRV